MNSFPCGLAKSQAGPKIPVANVILYLRSRCLVFTCWYLYRLTDMSALAYRYTYVEFPKIISEYIIS